MFYKSTKTAVLILALMSILGCGVLDFESDKHVSSSLLDYLYPSGKHIEKSKEGERQASIPHIELPARIGIAFVPKSSGYSQIELGPTQQLELLQKAKVKFSKYKFVEHIEMIPANYLQSKGGFTNLKQIAALYDVDLMALVSYDQVQKSYSKDLSLLYLTVVGAYLFKGDDNHTQSFVDTAVFDVKTQTLLFRAPGSHKDRKNSSLNDKELVQDKMSHNSFELAMQEMLLNLDGELNVFTDRVKNEKVATVSYKSSYSGGGSLGLGFLFLFLLILSFRYSRL